MPYPPTAVDAVVEGLRGRILSGSLQPGTSLPPERELASQLAVSRATLREGLSILSQMGLLSIHRGRTGGAVVTAPPATIVSASIALLFQTRAVTAGQLCEFRRALEVEAAQLAAVRRSPQELKEIATSLDAYVASSQDTARTIVGMICMGLMWLFIDNCYLKPFERATIERWGVVVTEDGG